MFVQFLLIDIWNFFPLFIYFQKSKDTFKLNMLVNIHKMHQDFSFYERYKKLKLIRYSKYLNLNLN